MYQRAFQGGTCGALRQGDDLQAPLFGCDCCVLAQPLPAHCVACIPELSQGLLPVFVLPAAYAAFAHVDDCAAAVDHVDASILAADLSPILEADIPGSDAIQAQELLASLYGRFDV